MLSRAKSFRANSLSRELKRLGGSTVEEDEGFSAFCFHWFHHNTILINDNVTQHGHDCVFIGCTDKRFIVSVHHYKFGSFDDVTRHEFNYTSGFSLLWHLVKINVLSPKFMPVVNQNYINTLLSQL